VTDLIIYAIPAFVLLLVVEVLSFKVAEEEDDDLIGYEVRDTRTSLSMGGGNVLIHFGYAALAALGYTALYELSPWQIEPSVLAWVALFFLASGTACSAASSRRASA